MGKSLNAITAAAIGLILMSHTGCEPRTKPYGKALGKDELIERNKARVSRESQLIEAWVAAAGWPMERTQTGLYFQVYGSSAEGEAQIDPIHPQSGHRIGITYSAYLLDSTKVASSNKEIFYFYLGHDDVVSGLHEVMTLLSPGDSARVLIPSYMAYGLTGLSPSVPPNSPLLYDLYFVEMR